MKIQTVTTIIALTLTAAYTLPAWAHNEAVTPAEAREIAKEALYLRLPAGGQLSCPVRLLRGPKRSELQSVLEPDQEH